MPLNNYFIGFIAIVTIIRLGLILSGPLDAREKTAKAGWWIIGLFCIVTAWLALGTLFGVSTDGFGKPGLGSGGTVQTKTTLDDENVPSNNNPNTYYGTGYNEQTSSGEITVNPVDKP